MNEGRIQAQGTFNELSENEYLRQILDIDSSHTKENQQIASEANSTEASTIDQNPGDQKQKEQEQLMTVPETIKLSDAEIERKLVEF